MPLLSFGEYRPDVSDYEGQHSKDITNVVPQINGYGPFADLSGATSALPGPCRGIFYAIKNDGSVAVFAGTSTDLYILNNATGSWVNVSAGAVSYGTLATGDNWQFAQANNFVFATQVNATVQVYDLTISTQFAALGGSPPQAKYISIINQFVFLSGLASPNVYRVQWSGLDDFTTWTAGVNQSDFQDLADGGIVRGIAGGEFGTIFQDRAIRRITFAPNTDVVFTIERISADDGLYAPYSIINTGEKIFFLSPQGFKLIIPGGYPVPIGREKVDRTFFADVDIGNIQLILGATDPTKQRVYWAYKSINGTTGQFDKVLCYDWSLDRWSVLKFSGQFLTSMSQPGLTLEQVDAAYANPATPVAITSVATSTGAGDTFTVAASPAAGQGINFTVSTTTTNTAAVPTAYTVGVPYYVKATGRTSTTFRVSSSGGVGALEGAATTSTSTGLGTLSYFQPSLETVTIASLDDIPIAAQAQLSGVTSDNELGFFTGSNLEATLESAQHGDGFRRIYLRGFRPITDAPGTLGSISHVDNLQSTVAFTTEETVDARGMIWARIATRYARGKIRIPAGTSWSFALGVEPDVVAEGQR